MHKFGHQRIKEEMAGHMAKITAALRSAHPGVSEEEVEKMAAEVVINQHMAFDQMTRRASAPQGLTGIDLSS